MRPRKEKEKKPVRAIPLPEAIDGQRWEIRQSNQTRVAGIATSERTMVVPMGDNDLERLIRLHEMTHISITPRERAVEAMKEEGVDEQLLNLCEDARVHSQMERLHFNILGLNGVFTDKELNDLARESHPAILAAIMCATYGTGEWSRIYNRIDDEDRRAIAHYGAGLACYRIHGEPKLPTFETTIEIAKEIQENLGDPQAPEPPKPPPVPPAALQRLAEKVDPKTVPPVDINPPARKRPVPNAGKGPWLNVKFEEPPRPLKFPPKMKGLRQKRIPAQRGRRLHRIGRLHVDGYVFGDRPKKKGGGAIVIDTSGSMSLTKDEVLQLCVAYPGGVIASYSSCGGFGTLRIIAKNGKRVEDNLLSTPGEGNGIDGPALDWLARQPGPRFWISDAGVEGGATGLRYCLNVCRKYNITRVDNAWDIVGKTFDE